MAELWELYPHIWPTKASFFTWLRGKLRKAVWNTYPIKLDVLRDSKMPPPDGYTGRSKKFSKCALSGDILPTRNCQVDHKVGNIPLQEWDDVTLFIKHLLAKREDLQVVSKDAHKIKSYSEREGITFNEAMVIKQAIALVKQKKDKAWLVDKGVVPANNATKRRQQIINILTRS